MIDEVIYAGRYKFMWEALKSIVEPDVEISKSNKKFLEFMNGIERTYLDNKHIEPQI